MSEITQILEATEQNDAEAQRNLGPCQATGQGVAKDEVEAHKWWLLAGSRQRE